MDDLRVKVQPVSGYHYLFRCLREWGITRYAGVTGGGVIHFLKHLAPLDQHTDASARFFNIAEYTAGFIPLGYYLASGKIAAAVATTGAASKLLSCGLSDAKLHNIPAVYVVPLSPEESHGRAALQDTTCYGSNIVQQFRSELPDAVFVLDAADTLIERLGAARNQLARCKPVVLCLLHNALTKSLQPPGRLPAEVHSVFEDDFVDELRRDVAGRRLVILVGEEMARYADAVQLTTQLSVVTRSALIWTINGANAVQRHNPYGHGYIMFGGNNVAIKLYQSIGEGDVLLVLGACPDEYTANLKPMPGSKVFFFSCIPDAYGQIGNEYRHFCQGAYRHVSGPLDRSVRALLAGIAQKPLENIPSPCAPASLNLHDYPKPRHNHVDMAQLYQRLDRWWPPGSIGFDDVCLAYKDRHYVTQRPNGNIRFHSLYRGSAMGGAFGAAVGASLASANRVFLFTGDGCWRLFAGTLGEASELGLVMFLINNASLAIVAQGLPIILPDIEPGQYHASLKPLDYCAIARACGWEAEQLKPDLSNLEQVLAKAHACKQRSLLIDIPVDPQQVLGSNPRVNNL